MKNKYFKLTTLILLAFTALIGCKKDFEASKPTYWPVIEINGPSFVAVPFGDTYTDAGATVTVNGATIDYTTDNQVDDSQLGVYTVEYSAVNEDGIAATATRTVAVVDTSVADDDISASYTRVGQAGTVINWVKHPTQPYTYICNNVGGVPPSNANYAAFNVQYLAYYVGPGQFCVPLQSVGSLAPFYCTASLGGSTVININPYVAAGSTAYAYVVNGANFGTGLRTFKKL
jgi:hypothetical protein